MKKIIIAFDGKNYSANALEFAALLNEVNPVLLTGIFTPNISFAGSFVYPTEVPMGNVFPLVDEEMMAAMEENVEAFENFCIRNGIEFRIHKDMSDFALPELKYESRFADVMLLSSQSFFSNPYEQKISELFKEILHISECPVVVLPENYKSPGEIILAYDGTEDAVHAIKQFAYLFPELTSRPCLLVYAHLTSKKDIPDISNIEELAARHFSDLTIEKLELTPHYFATWLGSKKSPFLVTGSFGRSSASRFFRKSFISDVIINTGTTIFVAHR